MNRAASLVLIVLLLVGFAYWQHPTGWNERSRLDLIRAIVEQGTFRIDAYHANTGDKAFFNEHWYSDKAPGAAVLGVPVHFVIWNALGFYRARLTAYLVTLFAVSVPSVIACLLLLKLLQRAMPGRDGLALALVLAYALGTIALPYSSRFFGHQVAAAALIGSFYLLIVPRAEPVRRWRVIVAGFLLGFAVITEYPSILLAGLIALYALWRASGSSGKGRLDTVARAAALLLCGAAWPLVFLLSYNSACFGHPLASAYPYHVTYGSGMAQGFSGMGLPTLTALKGITIASGWGLFFVSPFLVLALPGVVLMIRDPGWRAEGITCAAAIVLYFLFACSYRYWHGVSAIGPRFLVPVLPMLMLPIGWVVRRGAAAVGAFAGLAILSAFTVWSATAAAVDPIPEITSVLWGYWAVQLQYGSVTPNWGTLAGLRGLSSLVPIALVLIILIALLIILARAKRREAPPEAAVRRWSAREVSTAVFTAAAVAFVAAGTLWHWDVGDQASHQYSKAEALLAAREYAPFPPPLASVEYRLRTTTAIRPDLTKAWGLLAAVQVKAGRPADADQTLAQAFQQTSNPPEVLEHLVADCLRLGSTEYARDILRQLVAANPDYTWAKEALRSVESQLPAPRTTPEWKVLE